MSFLQTLAAAFKGGAPVRVPLARTFTSPWLFAEGTARAPFEYSGAVRRAYLENPVAQRAVRLVAEGIGGAPLLPTDPKLAALVGATSAGQALLETLAAQLLLHGDAYVQVMKDGAGRPAELFALRPERVSVIAGEDGWPAAYTYRVGERSLTIPVLDEDASPNLIHIRHFHPVDDHYGAGCLAAADQAVAVHNAAADWNRALLENAARPSGALVYDPGDGGGLSADQFERSMACSMPRSKAWPMRHPSSPARASAGWSGRRQPAPGRARPGGWHCINPATGCSRRRATGCGCWTVQAGWSAALPANGAWPAARPRPAAGRLSMSRRAAPCPR